MHSKLNTIVATGLLAGLTMSCKGLFEYHPNQIVLEEKEKNLISKNVEKIKNLPASDTIKVIVTSDTHQWLDETADFVTSANKQPGISFVAHLGDLTATTTTQEFKWFAGAMSGLNTPYVTALGETDTPGDGAVFKEMFGDFNYSFSLAGHKFVVINTNSSVFPASANVPDLAWLSSQIAGDAAATNIVVLAHTPPFDANFKNSLQQDFAKTLSSPGKVKLSLFGHQHTFSESEPYQDRVKYYVAPALGQRQYLIVSLWAGGQNVQKVSF